ncbi:TauD/TfdA family dioxygenase [Luteolibacter ambystomatis]|uniref:TauD/TfdA family dioxygenase n=1 Tax=Luteolibacter ambystomatis TaxID=2824561 RepID=A0A975G8N9_9BACT|nr:TauD/TfdA family dioxygenase [Luteolibacter ambystomatis]QUE51387.1 TauD/TfdA family dioxygenase [Luteolibacter ambystomatis]
MMDTVAASLPVPATREHSLPLLITPDGDTGDKPGSLTAWVGKEAARLRQLRLQHGALLFRGFGFEALQDFQTFVSAFTSLQTYQGGASRRTKVEGLVYTSTDMAAHYEISQHHESAYTPAMPAIIGFLCGLPSETGGETPLADARRVTARLPEELKARFEEKGLLYLNNLPNHFGFGKTWQAQFESGDRDEVEAKLRENGYEWEWKADGSLRTVLRCAALLPHPETGRKLWINQADHWHPSGLSNGTRAKLAEVLAEEDFPMNVTYGDGSVIAESDLELVRGIVREETTQFTWQKGDVLICDNFLVSHGRRSFTGERKVYVALG